MWRRGFTLIEVMIIVMILGILAGIVIPQFTSAADTSKLGTLKTNLATIRAQIEMYKFEHNETYPTSAATLVDQLTLASKPDGSTAALGTAGFNLGPYLQQFPNNPFTDASTVGSGAVGSSDWYYDAATGQFRANDDAAHTGY